MQTLPDPLSTTFAALADPTRRAILARLALGEATVTELAAPYDLSLRRSRSTSRSSSAPGSSSKVARPSGGHAG